MLITYFSLKKKKTDKDDDQVVASTSKSQFRGLQFHDSKNASRIYLAVRFLRDHLRDRAQLDDDNFHFSTASDGGDFKHLIVDLEQEVPMLKGVTAYALRSMYAEIVDKRRELEEFLRTATGDPWASTRLSDMAWDLVLMDDEMRARQERKAAVKERRVAEAAAREVRTTWAAVSRKVKGKHPDQDISSSSSSTRHPPQPSASSTIVVTVPSASTSACLAHVPLAPPPPLPLPLPQQQKQRQPQPLVPSGSPAAAPPPRLTRQVPSVPSHGRIPLFSAEEQETFKEESRGRAMAIARLIQDLSTEVSAKNATYETNARLYQKRVEALEARVESLEKAALDMDERVKSMEDMVKGMKDEQDRAFYGLSVRFQGRENTILADT